MIDYKVMDWVRCPGEKRISWVYGWIKVIRDTSLGQRILVDRGWLLQRWFNRSEITPAIQAQDSKEVADLRDALHQLAHH